jgi:hypothetical protein
MTVKCSNPLLASLTKISGYPFFLAAYLRFLNLEVKGESSPKVALNKWKVVVDKWKTPLKIKKNSWFID